MSSHGSSSRTAWARKWLIGRSGLLTAILTVLAAIGFYLGASIQLKLSLTDLLPDNHPSVVKFNELTKVVGGVGFFSIVLHAEDGKSHLAAAPKIAAELMKNPLVRSVAYHREQRYFTDRMLYYFELDQLKELDTNLTATIQKSKRKVFDLGLWDDEPKKEEKPVFDKKMTDLAKKSADISEYLTSKDNKYLLVMAKPNFDSMELQKTKDLAAYTDDVLKRTLPPGVTYQYAERYYNKIVETDMIQTDIFVLGSMSILLIALTLLFYLRSIRALVVIFGPVFIGLGITIGLARVFIGHINIITGFLMGIVSGLGVDYGIHLLLRLRLEKTEPSSEDPDPVWRTIASSGHSVFIGALAASFAFYLLCFSKFRAFSEFGFICGTGIAAVFLALLASFSFLARLMRENRTGAVVKEKKASRWQFPVLPVPNGLIAGVVITLALIGIGSTVQFEYDFDKMMRYSKKMEDLANLVDDIYGRSSVPSAIYTKTREEAVEIEKFVKEKYVPGTVSEILSGATIIPDHQNEKEAILARLSEQVKPLRDKWIEESLGVPGPSVRAWLAAKPFTIEDIPAHVRDVLRGTRETGFLTYLYPAFKLSNAQGVRTFASMVREIESTFPDLLTGSDAVIFSDILDLINHDGSIILIVIFFTVGFFIWLNVRRWDDTLASYLPLLISLPVGMGLMAIFGVKFNIFNIAIIPTFVAMGIDVPIHIVHRTREIRSGFKAARDLAVSINLALLTAAVGFGVLIFARAGVLKSMGWIALMGTLAIWWVGIFVLPSFLEWTYRRQEKTKGIRNATPTEA